MYVHKKFMWYILYKSIDNFDITILFTQPALAYLWFKKNTNAVDFLKCLVLCGYASFTFGWHVHEKAILMTTVPMW